MKRSWHVRALLLLAPLLVLISAPPSAAHKPADGAAHAPARVTELIAQLSGPGLQSRRGAGGAAQAEEAREEKIYARESKPDTRKYTRRQIVAAVPADPDHVYPLTLSYLVPVVASGEPMTRAQFMIALYSGRDRPERLVFWKKVGHDTYRKAKVMEFRDPDFREQHYETPRAFTAKVRVLGKEAPRERTELFVDVPMDGWRSHVDRVFAVVGGKLHTVRIQSAQKWYQPKLGPREIIWYPAGNSFTNDKLSFSMSIWSADDPMCCPSAGGVLGTYRIIEAGAAPGAKRTWKMLVASAKRKTPARCRQVLKKRRADKLTIWTRAANRGSPPSLSELLAALKSRDPRDRNGAAIMLDRVNPLPPEAIQALAEALKTPDPQNWFQGEAFMTLSRGGAAAIPALASLAQSHDPQKRRLAFQALGRIGLREPTAWPLLINGLDSAGADTAQWALAEIGAPVVPFLRECLKDPDPRVRAGAAAALAKMASLSREMANEMANLSRMYRKWPRYHPLPTTPIVSASDLDAAKSDLADALNDPDSNVRWQAAIALASVDPSDKRAIPGLVAMLDAKDPKLRKSAFTTLQLMGKAAKKSIPAIERALAGNSDPYAREQAARALAAIAGARACGALANAAADDKSVEVRMNAMAAMAGESPACPQALPALIGTLGQNQGVDRALTWYSLARLGKPAVPRLAEALKSPGPRVRQDAVHALARMNPLTPEAVDALMVALKDQNLEVRSLAAEALQNAGGEAKRAGAAELKRDRRILAEQSKPDSRRYRKEDIIAPIPPGADHAHPLTLDCLLPLYRYGGSAQEAQFLVSVHRGTDRSERLAFWKKTGDDQYELLKVVGTQGLDVGACHLGTPTFFFAKVRSAYGDWYPFVDVPVDGRRHRHDRVFVLDGDRVHPVKIESPEKWYRNELGKKETIRGPVTNSFTGGRLNFAFAIWKASDPQCCPTAGRVVGTYKVEGPASSVGVAFHGINRGMLPIRPVEPIWKMVVDTAEREPGRSR